MSIRLDQLFGVHIRVSRRLMWPARRVIDFLRERLLECLHKEVRRARSGIHSHG